MAKAEPAMRAARWVSVLSLVALVAACGGSPGRTMPRTWSVAWWYWAPPEGREPVDGPAAPRVYVQVTRSGRSGGPFTWPARVPRASEYVAVLRLEGARVPADADAAAIAQSFTSSHVQQNFSSAQSPVPSPPRGLQIDFDCPTASLPAYGRFLARLRSALPREAELSVTALLDWFPNPAVVDALAAVDEFVPQFYDLDPSASSGGIAHAVTPEWAARFDRVERPYRIGISTFGRIERVRGTGPASRAAARDLSPFDLVARLPTVPGAAERTPAGEMVVPFAMRGPAMGALLPGDRVEMILPTAASVHEAHGAARRFGGWCAGIVCFRWPWRGEDLVARPREVLGWIERGVDAPGAASLEARDGGCAPLHCLDLVLSPQARFAHETTRYEIVSTAPVAFVEPSAPGLLVPGDGSRLAAVVPPWSGADRIALGRVFTRATARVALAR